MQNTSNTEEPALGFKASGSVDIDDPAVVYQKPLPLNLQSSMENLSKLDVMLESKKARIKEKIAHKVDDRPKQSYMDPRMADLHHKISKHDDPTVKALKKGKKRS